MLPRRRLLPGWGLLHHRHEDGGTKGIVLPGRCLLPGRAVL
jgi:hypothetical protein